MCTYLYQSIKEAWKALRTFLIQTNDWRTVVVQLQVQNNNYIQITESLQKKTLLCLPKIVRGGEQPTNIDASIWRKLFGSTS